MKDFFLASLFFAVLIAIAGLIVMADTREQITYTGEEVFNNSNEALVFLENIATSAHSVNASINYNRLSVESPPTVKFSVQMPVTKSSYWDGKRSEIFGYGSVVNNAVVKDVWFSCLSIWGGFNVLLAIGFLLGLMASESD